MKNQNNQRIISSLTFMLTLFAFFGCSYNGDNNQSYTVSQVKRQSPVEIVIDDSFKNPKPGLTLRDIADSISYLPLETNDEIIIGNIVSVTIIENGYLINDAFRTLYFFNMSGKFIWRIDQQGRGPNEYEILNPGLAVDNSTNEIIIPDRRRLLFFNFNGEFVKELNLQFFVDQVYAMPDGAFLVSNSNPNNRILAYVISRRGDIIKEYYQHNLKKKIDDRGRESQFTNASIESYGNTVLLNSGDTVWEINSDYDREIRYILNTRVRNNKDQTYRVRYKHFQDTLIGLFFMNQKYNVIYNSVNGSFHKISGYGPSSAIVDNIDFGLDVPVWKEQNGIIIDAMVPSELLTLDLKRSGSKTKLVEIINSIDENDNPVLRFIYLKN